MKHINADSEKWFGMLDALAFLSVDQVNNGMKYAEDNAPIALADYVNIMILPAYLDFSQRGPPVTSLDDRILSNVLSGIMPTTGMKVSINSLCEYLQRPEEQSHPNITCFILAINISYDDIHDLFLNANII